VHYLDRADVHALQHAAAHGDSPAIRVCYISSYWPSSTETPHQGIAKAMRLSAASPDQNDPGVDITSATDMVGCLRSTKV
jgi:hypothetical protein